MMRRSRSLETLKRLLLIVGVVASIAAGAAPHARAAGNCPGAPQVGSSCVNAQAFGIFRAGGLFGCCFEPYDDAGAGGPGQSSAFAQSVSQISPPNPTALASADLATGQLKAYAESALGQGVGSAGASAEFQDTVTLIPPAGYAGSTIHVVLGLTVDATVSGQSDPFFPTDLLATLQAQLNPFSSQFGFYCATSSSGYVCPPNSASPNVTLAFDVPTSSPSFTIDGQLVANAGGTGKADAAHTGQLGVRLPAGIAFTSASGTLLSQAPKTDTTAPTVSITAQPANPTNRTSADFSFSGADPDDAAADLTFACKLDAGSFSPCTSPQSYAGPLADGIHTFAVHATDPAGNAGGDATYTWLVDATPPTCTVSAGSNSVWPPNHKAAAVTVTVTVRDQTAGPGPLHFVSQTATGVPGDIQGFDSVGSPTLSADGKTAVYTIKGQVAANKDESYSVLYSATDLAGNTTGCPAARVSVPHDQGQ